MKDRVDLHVGLRLRAVRLAAGATLVDVAKMLGVTYQQIQKFEQGSNSLASSQLFELCVGLDVPVSAFFDGLEKSKRADATTALVASKEAGKLSHFYPMIDNADLRRAMLRLVRELSLPSQRPRQGRKSAR